MSKDNTVAALEDQFDFSTEIEVEEVVPGGTPTLPIPTTELTSPIQDDEFDFDNEVKDPLDTLPNPSTAIKEDTTIPEDEFFSGIKEQLIKHEGAHAIAYTDSRGIRTVGVGYNLEQPGAKQTIEALGYNYDEVKEGRVELAPTDVNTLFDKSVQEKVQEARRVIPHFDELSGARKMAVTNMIFNMGAEKVEKGFPSFIKAMEDKDYTEAARQMLLNGAGDNYSKWFYDTASEKGHGTGRVIELASMVATGSTEPTDEVLDVIPDEVFKSGPITGDGWVIRKPRGMKPKSGGEAEARPEMSRIDDGIFGALTNYIDEVYTSFVEQPGLTRKAISTVLTPTIAVPEYDSEGNYKGARLETDEEKGLRLQEQAEERQRRSGFDQASGSAQVIGMIGSEVVDPVGMMVASWGLSKQGIQRLWRLAAGGGAYEVSSAVLDQIREENKVSDVEAVALRGAIGAVAGPVLDKALSLGKAIHSKYSKAQAEKLLTRVEEKVITYREQGLNPGEALNRSLRDTKLVKETLTDEKLKELRAVADVPRPKERVITDVLGPDGMTIPKDRIGRGILPKVSDLGNGLLAKIKTPKSVDHVLGVLSTRIKKISVATYAKVRKFDAQVHLREANYNQVITPFVRSLQGIKDKNLRKEIEMSLFNGDRVETDRLIAQTGNQELGQQLADVDKLLKDIHEEYNLAGIQVGREENYFPRVVKDYDRLVKGLGKEKQTVIQRQLEDARKKAPTGTLTEAERADIINKHIRSFTKADLLLRKPRVAKARSVDTVNDDIYSAYDTADSALASYVFNAAHMIEKGKFFGKSLTVDPNKNVNVKGSIGALLDKELSTGNITFGERDELEALLQARFVGGEKPVSKVVSVYRNVFYTSLLGQFRATLTQLGDLGIATYLNGFSNTFAALVGKNRVDMEIDFGLRKVAQEMTTTQGMAKAMEFSFKWSGFKGIDKIGKNTVLNGSLRKYSKMVKTEKGLKKFWEKHGEVFGDETEDLVKDLRDGKITENVKLLLWHDLADVQPISPAEMPAAYLNAVNGKIFYSLKTFTIKQLDIIRRDAIRNMTSSDPRTRREGAQNLMRFVMYFTAAGMSADVAKSWLAGQEPDMEDIVISNLWKNVGLSKYVADNVGREGMGGAIQSIIAPPTNVPDNLTRDIVDLFGGRDEDPTGVIEDLGKTGQSFRSLNDVPIVGNFLYNLFGGGAERYAREQAKKEAQEFDL